MAKLKMKSTVIEQKMIADGICSMWLDAKEVAVQAKPGQFISVYSNDKSRVLPRPISICEIDREKGTLRIVYRVVGKGTEEFSKAEAGDSFEILGPLGNGFPIEEAKGKKVLMIGGGIGVPPMLQTAKEIEGEAFIATEDGSVGTKGNVVDAIRENQIEADMMFACGPKPMLRALKNYALEKGIPCWISMEEKMACGVGACLACVCQSKDVDSHSHVHNKRICKDGPVFLSTEVEL